jgi:hypothetical protein
MIVPITMLIEKRTAHILKIAFNRTGITTPASEEFTSDIPGRNARQQGFFSDGIDI